MAAQHSTSARRKSAHLATSDLRRQIDLLNREAAELTVEDPNRTITLCEEVRDLLGKAAYPEGRIRNELTLGWAFVNTARYPQALDTLQELQPFCISFGSEGDLIELHYQFGIVYTDLFNHGQALFHAEESLHLARKLDSELDQAKGAVLLGTILMAIGLPDQALEQAFAALRTFERIDDKSGISKTLNNIGSIYNDARKYDRAIEFFRKSLAIKREIDDLQGVANTLNNIANILFWCDHEYSAALEHYRESLAISRAHGYTMHAAKSLQHMGQVYIYTGQNAEAIERSLEGVALLREIDSKPDVAYSLIDLGFVYYNSGQTQESIASILDGLQIAQELKAGTYTSKAYNLLRQIYREIKDFENATRYNELYIEAQEELFSEASDKRIESLTIQFEVEKTRQEKELYRLRTESLRQEMEHQSKELATAAMYLMQKNELLNSLNKQIEQACPVSDTTAAQLITSLQQQIQEALRGAQNWDYFEQQFKLIHHDFIKKLSELYPTLTPMELKVGALLRMNLSTKEIASLLCQSPRSVESYRYRLRRKTDIPSTKNLSTFLASL